MLTAGVWGCMRLFVHPPSVCLATGAWSDARKVFADMNDGYLAGVLLRWDSGGICFSLVFALSAFQTPSLQAALICDILFLLVCVREERREE